MSHLALRYGTPHHIAQADAINYLRRSVFTDAVAAGRLKPVARKGQGNVYYRFADVEAVSLDIASGRYPLPQNPA